MLHWLNLDDKGLVRITGKDGNFSRAGKPFSGEAIETFEQSPTNLFPGGWMAKNMAPLQSTFTTVALDDC